MFTKMVKKEISTRLWSLSGEAGAGKSLFATQFSDSLLVIDADHRFDEFLDMAVGEVYQLSENQADNINATKIAEILKKNMPGSGIKAIVVDTVTAIFKPLVTAAIMGNDAGENKNRVASFKPKAMAMQVLADALNEHGTDTLWLYHVYKTMDNNAKEKEASTVTMTERARLRRHLTLELKVVIDPDKATRGIFVEWARRGRSGITIWDRTGRWEGICELIEKEVYGGLTKEQKDAIEHGIPKTFTSPESAVAWAFDQGCFRDAVHAKNAYDRLKADKKPKSANDMWKFWTDDVILRKKENGEIEGESEVEEPVVDQPVVVTPTPEPVIAPVENPDYMQSFSEATPLDQTEQEDDEEPAILISPIFTALSNNFASSLDETSIAKMETWLIGKYTTSATPSNVRKVFTELTVEEVDKIVAAIDKNADSYLKSFTKELAKKMAPVAA